MHCCIYIRFFGKAVLLITKRKSFFSAGVTNQDGFIFFLTFRNFNMEFYLEVPWTCFLCKVVISKHISRHLSLQNKNKEIVEEDVSKLQWF